MNKNQVIIKLACLIGYILFAGFSAYFTASSLSLNLLQGTNLWLIFILVFIVALLAGWCLTNVISELTKKVGASKSSFFINLVGFTIFWVFSFTTNVHYFFVEKHGYGILTKELAGAKNYIIENTSKNNRAIDDQREAAIQSLTAQVNNQKTALSHEISNSVRDRAGFGQACISILKTTESIFKSDAELYGDKNDYKIFNESTDSGDIGVKQYSRIDELLEKYIKRIDEFLNTRKAIINGYYNRKKSENNELTDLLGTIETLETKHLPAVLKDGSVNAFYSYYEQQNGKVISKMPADFNDSNRIMEGDKTADFKIYPSSRMFDTMSVWGDIFKGRLKDMTMLQWIVFALIFDIVAFILFALFRKN